MALSFEDGQAVEIWNIPEERKIGSLPKGSPAQLEISPDGKALVTYEYMGTRSDDDKVFKIVIRDVDSLRKVSQVEVKLTDNPGKFRIDESGKTIVVWLFTAKLMLRNSTAPNLANQGRPANKEDWPAIAKMLEETPELEAQTVLELLEVKQPGRYNGSHLRTLQRRICRWRAAQGPEREIWFTQAHRPGEAAQTDFTSTAELGITILGQLFVHLTGGPCLTGTDCCSGTCDNSSMCI